MFNEHIETAKFIANMVVILGGVAGLYFAFKRWIRDVARDTKDVNRKINTKNGHTIGEQVDSLTEDFVSLKAVAEANSILINEMMRWRDEHVRNHPD